MATAVGIANLTIVCMCTAFRDVTLCSVADGYQYFTAHYTSNYTLTSPPSNCKIHCHENPWPHSAFCDSNVYLSLSSYIKRGKKVKVKWSCYRPSVAQRVGRGIALLFHDRGTRRKWVISSTPRLHFTPRKDPVLILQKAGWAPGPVWTGRKSRPHLDSIPDRPANSQSLYQLSYPAHTLHEEYILKRTI